MLVAALASARLKLSFGATGINVGQAAEFIAHMERQALQYRVFSFHDRLKQLEGDFLRVPALPICHLPLYSMAILLDGSAILCCQDWESRRVLGNVLANNTECEATVRHRSGKTLHLELSEGVPVPLLAETRARIPMVEGTVALQVQGTISQSGSSSAEMVLDAGSDHALDLALQAEGHW